MRVGIRLLEPRLKAWGFPRWGSAAAAGLDLHACIGAPLVLEPQAPAILIPAGFALEIHDSEWCGLIFPRSGFGHRDGLVLGNGTGVIDADYTGPILISAWNRNPAVTSGRNDSVIVIEPGDRIAQLVFTRVTRPHFDIRESGELDAAAGERGSRGFGSTGRR